MFTDVIRTAENEHEIYFLLTSYAEGRALRYDAPVSPCRKRLRGCRCAAFPT